MLLNCGVGEDSWESLELQGDKTSQSWKKSVLNIHWKDWCWSWNSNTLAPDVKNWLIWKDLYAGKDWMWEEKGMTEDEMVGWHHQLNGHEFEWTPGVGDRQGGLACCSPSGCKESYTTEQQNWTELKTNTGLAKKFVQVFLLHLLGKPERTYWLTQYLVGDLSKLVSLLENS